MNSRTAGEWDEFWKQLKHFQKIWYSKELKMEVEETGEKPVECLKGEGEFSLHDRGGSTIEQVEIIAVFACSDCDKTFSRQCDLNSHAKIHTGEKPFQCIVCRKAFIKMSNLMKHEIIHTGEKPFTCSTCNKSFTEKSNLTKHVRIHTGEMPFVCRVCNETFSEKNSLTEHMANSQTSEPVWMPAVL